MDWEIWLGSSIGAFIALVFLLPLIIKFQIWLKGLGEKKPENVQEVKTASDNDL